MVCFILAIYEWWLCFWGLNQIWWRRPTNEKEVFLTFDDIVYNPKTTIPILQTLYKHNCSATLFGIGSFLKDRSNEETLNLLKKGIQNGTLALGNHGMHDIAHRKCSKQELRYEILGCQRVAQELGLTITNLFRPGHGRVSDNIIEVAKEYKQQIVLGEVYTFDPLIPFVSFHIWSILRNVRPGSIIILHDRAKTPKILETLLPELKRRGYITSVLKN